MGSSPSRSDRPRRVPLSRQPPIWMMVAVVLAALVPLAMQLSGGSSIAPAHARTEIEAVVPLARAAEPFPTAILDSDTKPGTAPELAVLDAPFESAAQDSDDLEPCPAPCDESEQADRPGSWDATTDARASRASRPALLTKATEACKEGDKKTARSTYRALPLGDSRRKEIRKACRRQGVWIL